MRDVHLLFYKSILKFSLIACCYSYLWHTEKQLGIVTANVRYTEQVWTVLTQAQGNLKVPRMKVTQYSSSKANMHLLNDKTFSDCQKTAAGLNQIYAEFKILCIMSELLRTQMHLT